MNKKYALLAVPILGLFLMCSVMAFDYSVRGTDVIKLYSTDYKVDISLWHNDGREPTCYTPLRCSNGINPQGQGTIQIKSLTKGFYYTLNLNLNEQETTAIGNQVFVKTEATGTFWVKGMKPQSVKIPLQYVYNTELKTVSLDVAGSDDYIAIPVESAKK